MASEASTRLTIDELSSAVEQSLGQADPGTKHGKVRAVPDLRTIRYYTTLGLIDRPAEMRGRTAYYGRRHLLQLVAIKRLQATGKSLGEVQAELAGLPDERLEQIAELPELQALPQLLGVPEASRPSRRAGAFWAEAAPAQIPAPAQPLPTAEKAVRTALPELSGVSLGPSAHLLIPMTRPLSEEDLEAIRASAAPLLALLAARGLVPPASPKENDE